MRGKINDMVVDIEVGEIQRKLISVRLFVS